MAINWTEKTYNKETSRWERDSSKDRVTHEGLVLTGSTRGREVQIMSDVWADKYYCIVWNPETGKPEHVDLGTTFENETSGGAATVDATPEVRALYDAHLVVVEEQDRVAAKKRAAREAEERKVEREKHAKSKLLSVRKGSEVVVTKGRKVPKGTRGTIFWTGSGNYGARVGLKDAKGATHWTAESNVTVVLPGTDPGFVPAGGWTALGEKIHLAEGAWLKSLPRKGDKVRVLESGAELKVFWQKDERLGLKKNPRSRKEDPVWVDAWEVAVLTDTGERIPTRSPDLNALLAEAAANPSKVEAAETAEPAASSTLASMPAPFCDIHSLEKRGEDDYAALNEAGEFLVALPAESAVQIQALLEG